MSLSEIFPPISMHGSLVTDKPECIIASNCGPLEYYVDDGMYKARQGSGGLVTTLLGAVQHRRVAWISLTTSKAGRPGGRAPDSLPPALANVTLHLLSLPQQTYDLYYHRISNNVLWPAQHFLLDPATVTTFTQQTRNDWEQGYCATNEAVASAIIRELEQWGTDVPVIIQDYQLYLVAAHVRAHYPSARLSHVSYIPWPDPRYLALLPEYMTQAIYHSMAMNDIIGFQTLHDARNFLAGATYFFDDAQVVWSADNKPRTLHWQGRSVQICVYPAMPWRQYVLTVAQSREAEEASSAARTAIQLSNNGQLILRIDAIEPTNNILGGFQAYERLLQSHPELLEHVAFLALLTPSYERSPIYCLYERQVRDLIEHINVRYGRRQWQPIVAVFGDDRVRALACLQYYDVLLVNPVIDGMNLIAKEGGLLNKRSGVIILSQTASVHDAIGNHVLSVKPLDIDATAQALYRALKMSREERTHRANRVREVLLQEDVTISFDTQIKALRRDLAT